MRYKKVLFLYNENAGKGDIYNLLGICMRILTKHMEQINLCKTIRPLHAMELCKEYGENVDLVVVLGGDGTVHECINGLSQLEKRPVLAILPGGTCNDFTRTLGITQNIERAAEEIILGKESPVDIIQANEHYFLNFWGIGLIAETSNNIKEEEKSLLGKVSYFLSAVRTLNNMDNMNIILEIDGKNIEEEAIMVLIANGKYIGGKSIPFQAIEYNDGFVDVFIVKNTNLNLLKEVIALRKESADEVMNKDIHYYRGKSIKIDTSAPVDVDMDGEVYTQTPTKINVLPNHLKVIKPVL
ncbi:diacylglycerol/lipid kinase family protein [Niallia sp. 03133]|uniref:diacylglycerol/lipid kinase family protein n=1 Tax=Niallia sp. 03133 TaxID=3458060 RepID=UPI004044CD22